MLFCLLLSLLSKVTYIAYAFNNVLTGLSRYIPWIINIQFIFRYTVYGIQVG